MSILVTAVSALDGQLTEPASEEQNPIVLRTGDRGLFKRCRRLWGWTSHMMQGRIMRENADYLWFGSGVHYALEDFHGPNVYGHPTIAFLAYLQATSKVGMLPGTWQEHKSLGMALMSYYADYWLSVRPGYKTHVVDGEHQVEVNGVIDLGTDSRSGRRVLYGFTLDRVIADSYGRLWIVEYKTAKAIKNFHLDVDEQITAYCWCAWKFYGIPVAGVVYQQHLKKIPNLPKVLANGKVSTDLRQATTAAMYGKLLIDMYGSVEAAPQENINAYNHFRMREDEDKDKFIVRTYIERNQNQLENFERRVYLELEDMLNPDLPLYPYPTQSCDYMCPLEAACVAMEDGSDWQQILSAYSTSTESALTQREKEQMKWRTHLPKPQEVELPPEGVQYSRLLEQLDRQPEEVQLSPEEALAEELGLKL